MAEGAAADIPTVVVDGGELAVVFDADGVEVAADGFVVLLQGTEGDAVGGECGVGACAVVDEWSAEVAVLVAYGYALPLNGGASFWSELGKHFGQHVFQLAHLAFHERRPAVALDAAGPAALPAVAAEAAVGDIVGDNAILYYYHPVLCSAWSGCRRDWRRIRCRCVLGWA